ncbi:hypothetical protein AGMMS50256_27610 [Betaproteobacteria bacterium]|nr:hypothetical protein AGMMS50256_27610 [Betaproteobacteria bacterium]
MTKEFSYIPADNGRIEQWRDTGRFGYPEAEFTHAVTDEEWALFSESEQTLAFVDGQIAPWVPPEIPYEPPPPPEPELPKPVVPKSITMRQARLALLGAGLLAAVDAAIASMEGVQGEAARIEWEYAASVERNNPLFAAMAGSLELTDDALDQLFIAAAKL